MITHSWRPNALAVTLGGSKAVLASAQVSDDGMVMTVQLVNARTAMSAPHASAHRRPPSLTPIENPARRMRPAPPPSP